MLLQWNPALRTPAYYGHPDITDIFVCPDEKLIHFFKKYPSYYGHPLIRTTEWQTPECSEWQTPIDRQPRFTDNVDMNTDYSHSHDSCSGYHFRAGVGQLVFAFLHSLKYSSLSEQMQWQILEGVTEYLTSEKLTETAKRRPSKVWSKIQYIWLSRRLKFKAKSRTFSKESVVCRFSRTVLFVAVTVKPGSN